MDDDGMIGLRPGSIAERLSTYFRKARDHNLRALIDRLVVGKEELTIIDMGGSVDYWQRVGVDFLQARNCRITIVNLVGSQLGTRASISPLFTTAIADACDLSGYADHFFDLAHSNSVVEHVKSWDAMKRFAAETRRVGTSYYVQTPNFWFPIDPHYYRFPMFHWLPRPLRAALFRRFPIAHVGRLIDWAAALDVVDDSRLLDRHQMHVLFPDAMHSAERLGGLAKSLIAIRETKT